MSPNETLMDLLLRYEELRKQGRSPSAEEICRDHPELLEEFKKQAGKLDKNRPLFSIGSREFATVPYPQDTSSETDNPALEPHDFLAPAEQADEIGRLGPYRILAELGRGGMGVVFKAEDTMLKRPVALKVMKRGLAEKEFRERFLREARSAAAVKHDNIVTIYQAGEERGVLYLALEYLEGESLEHFLRRGRRPTVPQLLRLGREMAEGLSAAHQHGLIHRDIKPANLWVEFPKGRIKILDFGLARPAPRQVAESIRLTKTGALLGTPAYMAPEQARGDKVDFLCDLFSLGIVLYRLGTGQNPFQRLEVSDTLLAVCQFDPDPPRQLNPALPPMLSDLIMQLLAKKKDKRPPTAQTVVQIIRNIEQGLSVSATPPLGIAVAPSPQPSPPRGEGGSRTAPISAVPPAQPPSPLVGAGRKPPAPNVAMTTVTPQRPPGRLSLRGMFARLKNSRRFWAGLASGAAVLTLAVYFLFFAGQGSQTSPPSPEGGGAENGKDKKEPKPGGESESAGVPSPLDRLDPQALPAQERYPWQPKELVAVLGQSRQRGWSGLTCLAPDPAGKRLIIGEAVSLHFCDAATLNPEFSTGAHQNGSYSAAAMDPTGTRWADAWTQGTDFFVGYHEIGQGGKNKKLWSKKVTEKISALTFHPRGNRLICSSQDDSVVIWDITDPKGPKEIQKITNCSTVSLSPDGKLLAIKQNNLRISDVTEGGQRWRYDLPFQENFKHVGFLSSGRLVTISDKGIMRLWELGEKPIQKTFAKVSSGSMLFAVSPKGDTFALSSSTLTVELWLGGNESFQKQSSFKLDETVVGSIHTLAFSADGQTLYTGTNAIRAWDVSGKKVKEKTPFQIRDSYHGGYVLELSPDSRTLACVNVLGEMRFWDLGHPQPKEISSEGAKAQRLLAFSADGETLASTSSDTSEVVEFWPVPRNGNQSVSPTKLPFFHARAAAYSPDGKLLALGGSPKDNKIQLWDLGGKVMKLKDLLDMKGPCNYLAFSANSQILMSGILVSGAGTFRVWDLSGDNPRERFSLPVKNTNLMGFSPEGKTAAVVSYSALDFYSLAGPQPIKVGRFGAPDTVCSISFSPDSRRLVTAAGNRLTVWDLASKGKDWEFQFPGPLKKAIFARDGRHVITLNQNGTVYILRLKAGPKPAA